MKVILYMAMSANGYIARENGEEDFLSHENWETFIELAKKYGNFIYGRKTYEIVRTWGNEYQEDLKSIQKKIIVSENPNFRVEEEFVVANSPEQALSLLQSEGFNTALLSGGSTLNSAFAKAGLPDEIILNIEPFVLGKGIKLFADTDFEARLELLETKMISSNEIQLHYKVVK